MNSALWVAKTGLDALQLRMNVVANNLANVNTTGFKRGDAAFEDLIYQNVRQVGAQQSQDTQLHQGFLWALAFAPWQREGFLQGNISVTENPGCCY